MKTTRYQEFAFVVEGMSEAQADELQALILDYLEERGLEMGGGCRTTTDADYPWFLIPIERAAHWLVQAWKAVRNG